MKKKTFIITCLLIFSTLCILQSFSMAKKKPDLFNEILKKTNSTTVEYGIMVTYETDGNRESIPNELLRKLDFYDGWYIDKVKGENYYCTEFEKNNTSGYIEATQYENHNIVTLNIKEEDNVNNLDELRKKLNKSLSDGKLNIKYYEYIKAKLPDNNISSINDKILELLDYYGSKDIETVQLENGYSTTAYTKLFDSMQINGKPVDFNYAVCKYSSGSYLIIGTPEINVTY